MNPYLKASLEELVELVNGNNDSRLSTINTHEEYLQAVEEHNVLTDDLHKHMDEFHKHCDNIDIANAASTIVQEIQSKGISLEDDMQIVLDIISKNTGIKVSNEEALTVLIIITVAILITTIIAKVIKNYLEKRKFNAFIDKELHAMEKAFEEITKDLEKEPSSTSKRFDDFLDRHKTVRKNDGKVVIKKVPKYLEHNDKPLHLELGVLCALTSKIKNNIRTLDTNLHIVSGGISHLSTMLSLNSLILSDSDTSKEKMEEKINYIEKTVAGYVDKSKSSKEAVINLLHELTSSKGTDLTELSNLLTLVSKETTIETNDLLKFSTEVSKNIESLNTAC